MSQLIAPIFQAGAVKVRHDLLLVRFTGILGDPGATSRDDAIFAGERHFWRESLLQGLKSPWALFHTK